MGGENSKNVRNEALTQAELDLLRTTWEVIEDKDELGIRLMIKMFSLDPEIKYLWIFASNLETEEEMWQNSELKYHARKVTNTVAKIVGSLIDTSGNSDSVDLDRLGRRHHTYGLKKEYFQVFEDALIYSFEKSIHNKRIFDDKAKKAWRKAVRNIFFEMNHGMSAEIKDLETQEKFKPKNLQNNNFI